MDGGAVSVGILLVAFLVFLLFREFWCWYLKVNKLVSLLQESNELQRAALRAQGLGASGLAVGDAVQLLSTRPARYARMDWEAADDPLLGKVGRITQFDQDGTFKLDIDPRGGWFAPTWVTKVGAAGGAGS